jgi:ubiquinone/menaquinone biosynthesis C-methylase UbiE
VALLGLERGESAADVGAGTGAFTREIARAVEGEGVVYAVDISRPLLWHIEGWAKAEGVPQVRTVIGREDDILMPEASVDAIFVCDTYHHFADPEKVLASIRRALRPGGRLVLVEFDRVEGKSSEFILSHVRAGREVFIGEVERAGFRRVEVDGVPTLQENFVAVFERADGPGAGR